MADEPAQDSPKPKTQGPPPLPPREPVPAIPIAEPGVVTPPPFASVYSPPPPGGTPPSMTMSPPQPDGFYPPAYPPRPADYYAYQAAPGRPGLITTLGVMSIVVAGLSLIASIFSGCSGVAALNRAHRSAAYGRAVSTAVPTPTANSPAPNGLTENERNAVIQVLASRMTRELTEPRHRQLNGFLATHGQKIISNPLDKSSLAQGITKVTRDYPTATGADCFTLGSSTAVARTGQLKIWDTHSAFVFDDGSAALRESVVENANSTEPVEAAQLLTAAQVNAMVVKIDQLAGGRLNPAQCATLRQKFSSAEYANWITYSSTTQGVAVQAYWAKINPDASVSIQFSAGSARIDQAGNVTSSSSTSAPGMATATAALMGTFTVDRGSCNAVIGTAGFSTLLAILLLVAGIFCLRQNPLSRPMFIGYAAAKLLCGVGAIWALTTMIGSMKSSDSIFGAVETAMLTGWSQTALVMACIGLVYPIAVLIVLLASKTVKDYYRTAR